MAYQVPSMPFPDNFNNSNFLREFAQGYSQALAIKRQQEQQRFENERQTQAMQLAREQHDLNVQKAKHELSQAKLAQAQHDIVLKQQAFAATPESQLPTQTAVQAGIQASQPVDATGAPTEAAGPSLDQVQVPAARVAQMPLSTGETVAVPLLSKEQTDESQTDAAIRSGKLVRLKHTLPGLGDAGEVIDRQAYDDYIRMINKPEPEKWQAVANPMGSPYLVNTRTGEIRGGGGMGGGTDDKIERDARALYEGQADAATLGRSGPYRTAVVDRAIQMGNELGRPYDPSLFAVRQKAKLAFTTGPEAQAYRAILTADSHLKELNKHYEDLGNTDYPLWNSIRQGYQSQTGKGAISGFNTTKDAVAGEIAKAIAGTGNQVAEEEIKTHRKNLQASMAPEQFAASKGALTNLLGQRYDQLNAQFQRAFGVPLTPENFKAATGMDLHVGGGEGNTTPAPAQAAKPGNPLGLPGF